MRAVTLPDGTRIEYVIDGQNRRIGKKFKRGIGPRVLVSGWIESGGGVGWQR